MEKEMRMEDTGRGRENEMRMEDKERGYKRATAEEN